MMNRRFTRLTNAFSKKLSHLKAALTLHFAYYNFCRIHSSIKTTPAIKAGITDHAGSRLDHCRTTGRSVKLPRLRWASPAKETNNEFRRTDRQDDSDPDSNDASEDSA